eukprot:sb/3476558/
MGSTDNEINALKILDNTVHGDDRNLRVDKILLDEKITKYQPSNTGLSERDQGRDYMNNLYDLAAELKEYLDGSEQKISDLLEAIQDTPKDGDYPNLMNQKVSTAGVYIANKYKICC